MLHLLEQSTASAEWCQVQNSQFIRFYQSLTLTSKMTQTTKKNENYFSFYLTRNTYKY